MPDHRPETFADDSSVLTEWTDIAPRPVLVERSGNRRVDADVIDLIGDGDGNVVPDLWHDDPELRIAVLIPCHDEAASISRVVTDFRRALPQATVYVYDNASSDATGELAQSAGAVVRHVPYLGKGNVLRQMFAEVEATAYVLVDGDGTYDPAAAPRLIHELRSRNLDMVVGRRVEHSDSGLAYRRGHRIGNRVLTGTVQWLFGAGLDDMLSGYRVFSRRYVKSFPATSRGFETETEMTVHALDLLLPFGEIPTRYQERPPSSMSKLRTIPDGIKILRFIALLCREHRPMRFFGALTALSAVIAVALGVVGSTAGSRWLGGAAIACGVLTVIFIVCGLVLDSVSRGRREVRRLLYLATHPTGPILVQPPDRHG